MRVPWKSQGCGGITSCNMRLSAQLLQTTWNQMELQFQSDVMKMREWALKFELFSKQQVVCYLGWLKSWKQRWVYPIYIYTYTHRNTYKLYIIHIFTFKVIVLRVWFVQVIIVVYSDILQLSNSLLNLDTPFYHHPGPSEVPGWLPASPGSHGLQVPERAILEGEGDGSEVSHRQPQDDLQWQLGARAWNHSRDAGSHGPEWVSQPLWGKIWT